MSRAAARAAAAACLWALFVSSSTATPIQVGLDAAAVAQAVRVGRTSGLTAVDPFHSAYRIAVDDPVVRQLEIVSEFRRVVQLTEERERLRDATWSVARAQNAARAFRGLLDVVVYLQFGPQNTYRTMPAYSLVLYDRSGPGAVIAPLDSRSDPSYVAKQPAPPGTPILSGTVTATFDATRLDPAGRYLVGVLLDGREIRRVPVDLARVR